LLYTRSDHFSYASKGVPVIFFTTGLHRDYHYGDETILAEHGDVAGRDGYGGDDAAGEPGEVGVAERQQRRHAAGLDPADEIVVSTLPSSKSRWLRGDLIGALAALVVGIAWLFAGRSPGPTVEIRQPAVKDVIDGRQGRDLRRQAGADLQRQARGGGVRRRPPGGGPGPPSGTPATSWPGRSIASAPTG